MDHLLLPKLLNLTGQCGPAILGNRERHTNQYVFLNFSSSATLV